MCNKMTEKSPYEQLHFWHLATYYDRRVESYRHSLLKPVNAVYSV